MERGNQGSHGAQPPQPTLTLAQCMDRLGVGLEDLVAQTGIGMTTLRGIVNKAGRGVRPRPEQVARVCKALDVEPRVLGWQPPMPLITARVDKGWSRDDLVKNAAVGKSTVARLENEEVAEPSAEVVLRLSRAVGVPPEKLGWRKPPPLVEVRVFELEQTQTEYAKEAGVGRATVERIERGEIVPKTAVTAWKLARTAKRTPLDLGWGNFDPPAEAVAAEGAATTVATVAQGQSPVREVARSARARAPDLRFRGHSVVVGDLMIATWPPLTLPDMPRLPQAGALQAGARKQILTASTAQGISQLRRDVAADRFGPLTAPQTGGVVVRRVAPGEHAVPWAAQAPDTGGGDLVPPVNVGTWRRDVTAIASPTERAFVDANRQAVVTGFRTGAQGAWMLEGALRSLDAARADPGLARGVDRAQMDSAQATLTSALDIGHAAGAGRSPEGVQRSISPERDRPPRQAPGRHLKP